MEEEEEEEKGKKGENPKPAFSTAVPMATSRFESQVYKMEVDPSTYTQPIEGAGHRKWAESFDVQEHTKEISDLLLSKSHLQQLHTQLVPTVVSYNEFWGRYFYHLHCIHEVRGVCMCVCVCVCVCVRARVCAHDTSVCLLLHRK